MPTHKPVIMDQGLEDLLKVESSLVRGASLFLPSWCSSSVDTLTEQEDFNGLVIKLVLRDLVLSYTHTHTHCILNAKCLD